MIYHGDLFDVLPTLAADSIDASCTDPPYGIGFMSKAWDTFKPENVRTAAAMKQRKDPAQLANLKNVYGRKRSPAQSPSQIEYDRTLHGQHEFEDWTKRWASEVLRVLKPGAHIVVCGAPRSHHRMMSGLEEAGFVIRDCMLFWGFGQGFPKSKNIGDGRGTALKPAYEPIALAWKPFKGSITANVEKFGTGALNIDACRIASGQDHAAKCASVVGLDSNRNGTCYGEWSGEREDSYSPLGRWPANVLLDEEAAAMLDEQTGEMPAGGTADRRGKTHGFAVGDGRESLRDDFMLSRNDPGGASRFYYVAKPSREERDYGCYDLGARTGGEATDRKEGSAGLNSPRAGAGRSGGSKNFHPTVKPVELMRWLVKLVTPPGGTVLDPFTGSGTTGMACRYESRKFIGIEREADYIAIAERRIAAVAPLFGEIPA